MHIAFLIKNEQYFDVPKLAFRTLLDDLKSYKAIMARAASLYSEKVIYAENCSSPFTLNT